jgi:hypothetical protein
VKKLFIGSAIVLLTIFTAGFAGAAPAPVCTATECNELGTLYFVAADGASITTVQDVALVIKPVTPATGQPSNFWTGTLTIPATQGLPATVTTKYNISAVKAPFLSDDPHLFRNIAGVDATGEVILTAEGCNNDFRINPAVKKVQFGFGISGKVYDGANFVGSFHGSLFPNTTP